MTSYPTTSIYHARILPKHQYRGGKWNPGIKKKTPLGAWFAIALLVIYFFRTTMFSFYMHIQGTVLTLIASLCIVIVAGYAILGGGNWRRSWCITLTAFGLSIFNADLFFSTLQRYIMLGILMIAVGPVVINPVAIQMRATVWLLVKKGMLVLLVISTAWYIFHLPCPFGRMPFAGFMTQSMLTGPFTGLGLISAFVCALHGNRWKWGCLTVIGVLPLLAASSRIAILATAGGVCFLVIRRKPLFGCILLFLLAFTIWSFVPDDDQVVNDVPASDSVMSGLNKKGIQNDRSHLWQARLDEFKSSPFVGIGIGMGEGDGVVRDNSGNIQVEPGSSYLAILSMTGALGALAFGGGLSILIYGFVKSCKKSTVEQDILVAFGIFFAVHGMAEGWVLSFGSPLCYLFWLWLGRFGDYILENRRVPSNVLSDKFIAKGSLTNVR